MTMEIEELGIPAEKILLEAQTQNSKNFSVILPHRFCVLPLIGCIVGISCLFDQLKRRKNTNKTDLLEHENELILLEEQLSLEEKYGDGGNFVSHARNLTNLIELEMNLGFGEKIKPVFGAIIEAHLEENKHYFVDAIEKWGNGDIPTTMGIVGMLLVGARRAVKQKKQEIEKILQSNFEARIFDYLNNKQILENFENIRQNYRNPIAHGMKVKVGHEEYSTLVEISFGRKLMREWFEKTEEFSDSVIDGLLAAKKKTRP